MKPILPRPSAPADTTSRSFLTIPPRHSSSEPLSRTVSPDPSSRTISPEQSLTAQFVPYVPRAISQDPFPTVASKASDIVERNLKQQQQKTRVAFTPGSIINLEPKQKSQAKGLPDPLRPTTLNPIEINLKESTVIEESMQPTMILRNGAQVGDRKPTEIPRPITPELEESLLIIPRVEPNCCKSTTSRLNHGYIEVENESSDDEDEELADKLLPRRRSQVQKPVKQTQTSYHLQPGYAAKNLEACLNEAHFQPGWLDRGASSFSPIELDVVRHVADLFTSMYPNNEVELKFQMDRYLRNTKREDLFIIGSPANSPQGTYEWKESDRARLLKLRKILTDQIDMIEAVETLEMIKNSDLIDGAGMMGCTDERREIGEAAKVLVSMKISDMVDGDVILKD